MKQKKILFKNGGQNKFVTLCNKANLCKNGKCPIDNLYPVVAPIHKTIRAGWNKCLVLLTYDLYTKDTGKLKNTMEKRSNNQIIYQTLSEKKVLLVIYMELQRIDWFFIIKEPQKIIEGTFRGGLNNLYRTLFWFLVEPLGVPQPLSENEFHWFDVNWLSLSKLKCCYNVKYIW